MSATHLKVLFEQAVPPDRLLLDERTLAAYARDMTEHPPGRPDIVIQLTTFDEAKAVVGIARDNGIPLIPRVAGTNLGGLSLAPRGGAILDLTGWKKIININEVDMIAIIEPGVTFRQLVDVLQHKAPPLTIGIPLSPPHTSIMANCLLDGLGNRSLVHGAMGQWITGLEVILASGQVVRTGAFALSDVPFSRSPLPDLTGLFVSWQGTTGLVSKMAVELKPRLPLRKQVFILTYDRHATYELMRRLARQNLFDDIAGLSWPTGKMLYGVAKPLWKDPDEPEFFTYIDMSGSSEAELQVKETAVCRAIDTLKKEQDAAIEDPLDLRTLCAVAPEFETFAEFPTDLDFLTKTPGGGLSWVGTYGPMSRFDMAADEGIGIMARHGFPPVIVSRPMKGGHFGVLRFIETFNREDAAEVENVRQCNRALTDMVLDHGFIPYKTPAWSVDRLLGRMHPGTHALMRQIHHVLDPTSIMNPGHWRLDVEEPK
ncbi:MAG: FAD-binding oxidoreductase [Myxococcota bacterium]|nr:FAD-binding oxidoreductase [Myxococcota bacterium]